MTPKYIGKTMFLSSHDQHWREYHVWASWDLLTGELESICYGLGSLLTMSGGPYLRQNCQSGLVKALWKFAEETIYSGLHYDVDVDPDDDCTLIEPPVHTAAILPWSRP